MKPGPGSAKKPRMPKARYLVLKVNGAAGWLGSRSVASARPGVHEKLVDRRKVLWYVNGPADRCRAAMRAAGA
jgi:hypothetical protein